MNKSLLTNLLAVAALALGFILGQEWLWIMGLFAFSAAITNWIAIHMLFEKVPFLYGSGVIPARFQEFKAALYQLLMAQFFSRDNLQRFIKSESEQAPVLQLGPVLESIDWSPAFDALLETVQKSSFGGMLAMFGGAQMLQPLKQPFIENLKASILSLSESPDVQQQLAAQLQSDSQQDLLQTKIASVVQQRLGELTPQLVKELVQQLIREHLGWLVVWGGVFGALIGLVCHLIAHFVG